MGNNFSTILGNKRLKITQMHRDTGISRQALTNFYYQRTNKLDMNMLEKICDYLQIPLSKLIEYEPKKREV